MIGLATRIKQGIGKLDPFVTRGAEPHHQKGMRALWLDNVLAAISGAFLFTYVPLYALALGATNTQIGTLSSAASLMGMLAPIPGAQLAERWGSRKRVVVTVWTVARTLTMCLLAIPFFLHGEAAVYAIITLWAIRAGLANLAHPAWVSLSADITAPERRGRFFSSRNMAMALASMLFVPLAGRLIDAIGSPQGYQWSVGLSALFGFAALAFYAQIPEPPAARSAQAHGARTAFWHALTSNKVFLLYTLIMMLWNLSIQLGGPFFRVYQVKELGSSTSMVGMMSMVMSLTRVIGQRFWGQIVDRRGSRWVMTVCAMGIPVVPWIWALTTQPWHVIFMSLPGGFIWAGFELASFNVLLDLPDQEGRTQAIASYTTVINVASIVGPILGGWVIDRLGYRWDFVLSGCGRLLAGFLFAWLLRPFSRSRAAAT
jgi:MFS family permease